MLHHASMGTSLLLDVNTRRLLAIISRQLGLLLIDNHLVFSLLSIATRAESTAQEAGNREENQQTHEDEQPPPPVIIVNLLLSITLGDADGACVIVFFVVVGGGVGVGDGVGRESEAEVGGGEDEETALLAEDLLIHLDGHRQGFTFSRETSSSEINNHAITVTVKLVSFEVCQHVIDIRLFLLHLIDSE